MVERELTCQELVELITGYIEETLPSDEHDHFERHLALCPGCRDYLAQMHATLRLLGALSAEALPEATRHGLLAAFRGLRNSTGSH
jgi:anti-sigma factor RsiW